MSTALAIQNGAAGVSIMEEVIAKGDLAQLKPEERARYYMRVCESIGVNPLTKPFDYINLNGKLTLYATKTATDQLRTVKAVSIFKVEAETTPDGMRVVTAYARDATGREDMDLGVVNVGGLKGEALANAYMKALTKAKRRVTLSICGLGWLDESEIESVPSAQPITVDMETGEILDVPAADTPADDGMVTKKQLDKVAAMANEIGMSWDQVRAMHGKASAKELTKAECSDLIDKLQAILDDMPEQDGPEIEDIDTGEHEDWGER